MSVCPRCNTVHSSVDCAEPANDPHIGQTIADRYRITRIIGRGGMGSVYEAKHSTIDRRFAIKFLLPEYATNHEVLRRFENEARAAGKLEHMNIAAVTDCGRTSDGAPYLVMEYLVGQDCAALLSRSGAMAHTRATSIVYQACQGLAIAHRAGIVHRDVKPENLFVQNGADGEDWVKILDFGIAKLRRLDASAVTGTGVTMGTIFYMSPEQIRNSAGVDRRTDVWALGVVLYELLTNTRPFGGRDITEAIYQIVHVEPERIEKRCKGLPKPLADAIHRALQKDADKRFPTTEALAVAIRPFTSRPSIPAPSLSLETDETIASADHLAVRPPASTSQIGATALPPSSYGAASKARWTIPTVGVVLAIPLALYGVYAGKKHPAQNNAAAAAPPDVPSVVLDARPSIDHVASADSAVASARSAVTIPSNFGQPSIRSQTGALATARLPLATTIPSTDPTRIVPPAPTPPVSPKEAQGTSKQRGVPITIDSSNPF